MKILYLGEDGNHSSSLDRARALMRLGHSVNVVNPQRAIPASRLLSALHYRTGFRFCRRRVANFVLSAAGNRQFEVVWTDGGRALGPSVLREFRRRGSRLVNYNLDDPFGGRDGRCWDTFRQSVSEYDLLCVVRVENVGEAAAAGAKRVLRVWRGYDPAAHRARVLTEEDRRRWRSDVLFIGTWMPERGAFLADLARCGVPLAIYGNRWQKAREWAVLQTHWRGPGLLGDDYVKAIQSARISLGLLSRGNRDLHTQRSAEIPFIGGLLCADRTHEHRQMYREDAEAVFWRDAGECVEKCRWLLRDETMRRAIVAAGRARVLELGIANDEVMNRILNFLLRAGHDDGLELNQRLPLPSVAVSVRNDVAVCEGF
jgi:hypothetical protein